MSKNTAVEWLVTELRNRIAEGTLDAIAISKLKMQAKAMEREQLKKAYKKGCMDEIDKRIESCVEESCKTDNETYKGGEQSPLSFEEMVWKKRFPDEDFDADNFYDWAAENGKDAFYVCIDVARDLGL